MNSSKEALIKSTRADGEILVRPKVPKLWEYFVYFPISALHGWGQKARRSADLFPHPCGSKKGKYIQDSTVFWTFGWGKISRCQLLPNYSELIWKNRNTSGIRILQNFCMHRKLEKDSDSRYIQTHVGIGYRMLKNGWRLRQFMDKLWTNIGYFVNFSTQPLTVLKMVL